MTSNNKNLPDELPKYGPRMLALPTDRMRGFVLALFSSLAPTNTGVGTWAARAAGYRGNPKSLSVKACELRADPRIKAAIKEVFDSQITTMGPTAIRELRFRLEDRASPGAQVRAIKLVADRISPPERKSHVVIEDARPPTPEMQQRVLERINEIVTRLGLAPVTPPKVIDVTPVEDKPT